MAWYWHWVKAWTFADAKVRRAEIMRRVAFATRYGHIGYAEAVSLAWDELNAFVAALTTIIEDENRPLEKARASL